MKKHITQLVLVSIMIFTQSCADYGLGGNTDTANTLMTKPYPPLESSDGNIKLFRSQRFSIQDFRRAF